VSKTKIFLIEEDNDARQLFREFLKSENYQISLAIDEEDALERAANGFQKIALVLINLLGKSLEEILKAGRAICRAGKINAPLVVLARKYSADLEGTNLRLGENEYVTYLRDGEQLSELLSTLTARA
jgi:DNA-binding response OmpR family regulator